VASWLVPSDLQCSGPVRALAEDIVLCSCTRYFTLTLPLSTKVYKWVLTNFMLGVTLRCVTKNCLSQVLEQSRTGSHSAVTNLYKNIPEHSNPYVITLIGNCVKLLNLAPNRSF